MCEILDYIVVMGSISAVEVSVAQGWVCHQTPPLLRLGTKTLCVPDIQ